MKILGFQFVAAPGVKGHVELLKEKYRKRAWVVRHLKRAGVSKEDLVKIYCSLVRSIFDYSSSAYHTLLTDTEAEVIERMQRMTLKTIFGHQISYQNALEEAGLTTLSERREKAFEKFCLKLSESNLYEDWLPENEFIHYDLRVVYKEKFARTEKLYKSPLYAIRRKLNEITDPKFNSGAATL
jgi:hypothetical protein